MKKLFIFFFVTIILSLIAKYVKDNGLISSAEPNVVQAIEKEKVNEKEWYEAPDQVPDILSKYSEDELISFYQEIVAYQDLATETAYNVWGIKNEFMKEAGLYNELDSISRIEFLLKHNLTKEFHSKLILYGAQKRWPFK